MSLDPLPYPLDHLARRGAPDAAALTVADVPLTFAELYDARPRGAQGRAVKPLGPIPAGVAAVAGGQLLISGVPATELAAEGTPVFANDGSRIAAQVARLASPNASGSRQASRSASIRRLDSRARE